MYIDFADDKLEVVDKASGECRSVEVFVAILPCSHYTYCEAVWSQCKEDLIKACENALHFYGGVPMAVMPDNLKSAVTRSNRNEPILILDDLFLVPLDVKERPILLDIIEDRHERKSIIITSQLPVVD